MARCSQGSDCSTTGCTRPGCGTSGSASVTSSAAASSPDGGPAPGFSTTCEPSELTLFPASTSSPAASRARAPQPRGSGPGSIIPKPFCGVRWPEPLASFDPVTCSWRTWRTSLFSTTEPSGERFSGRWPRSGSMSSGTVFPQRPSAPRTSVTGSSPLLPTPRASERENRQTERTPSQQAGTHGKSLLAEAVSLLPTPAATDYGNNQSPSAPPPPRPSLPALVRLLPTPVGGDSRNSRSATAPTRAPDSSFTPGTTLSDVAYEWIGASTGPPSVAGKRSTDLRLSPWFVEWMIGAPPGWSDPGCPLSATEFSARSAGSLASTSPGSSESG